MYPGPYLVVTERVFLNLTSVNPCTTAITASKLPYSATMELAWRINTSVTKMEFYARALHLTSANRQVNVQQILASASKLRPAVRLIYHTDARTQELA
jgi:hypothetical protein